MCLIDPMALACLGEIYAADDESGSVGSAAHICSTWAFLLPTKTESFLRPRLEQGGRKGPVYSLAKPGIFA
jgi:hypothetical protein